MFSIFVFSVQNPTDICDIVLIAMLEPTDITISSRHLYNDVVRFITVAVCFYFNQFSVTQSEFAFFLQRAKIFKLVIFARRSILYFLSKAEECD